MSLIKVDFFTSLKKLSLTFLAACISLCLVVLMGTGCNSSKSQEPAAQNPCSPLNPFSDPAAAGGTMCQQFYALCIAAPCDSLGDVAMTGYENSSFVIGSGLGTAGDIIEHALCKCPLVNGNSIGKASCNDRKLTGTSVISTYSFQFNNSDNKLLTCNQDDFASELKFADCYNQPCELDPADPTQVICTCPVFPANVTPSHSFVTRGGQCNKSRCTELWSAGPLDIFPTVNAAMACGIGNPEPADEVQCQ